MEDLLIEVMDRIENELTPMEYELCARFGTDHDEIGLDRYQSEAWDNAVQTLAEIMIEITQGL